MQDDHRLDISELEKKYGTSIDKVSAQGFLKELPPSGPSGLPRAPQEQQFGFKMCVGACSDAPSKA